MALLNNNPANKVTCCDLTGASQLKSLKLENYGFSIIQGANTLFSMLLKNFFLPVNNYQYSEFVLNASSSVMLDPGNVSNGNGEVTGLIMSVEYPSVDVSETTLTESQKYIKYSYHSGQELNISKLMVLTGTDESGAGWNLLGSPGGMIISNPHSNFDVTVKVLVIS
jgi:hypothetical protein